MPTSAQALALGAVAIVVEELPSGLDLRGRPAIVVADTRRALAALATRFYGEPSAELALIGVTGTNGKTSTTYLIESILGRAGRRVGLIGTVEARFGGQRRRSINTTPESLDLQTALRDMRNRGADAVVMEVSSHGLQLGRVDGCRFSVGAFTNLTQDHLDFHGTMAAYRDAKALLFTRYLAKDGSAVVNVDDPAGAELALRGRARRRARDPRLARRATPRCDSRRPTCAWTGRARASRSPGAASSWRFRCSATSTSRTCWSPAASRTALGVAPEVIAAGVAACPQVPGRVERVAAGRRRRSRRCWSTTRTRPTPSTSCCARCGRSRAAGWSRVFGCGGDRDRAKRPLMAEAVARWSDLAVATSDNPRSEDPRAILADVERGLGKLDRVEPGAARLRRATPTRC